MAEQPVSKSEMALANYVTEVFEEAFAEGQSCAELCVFFLRRIRNGQHTIAAIDEAVSDIGWEPHVKLERPQTNA